MKEVFYDERLKNERLAALRAMNVEVREFHYGGKYGKPKVNRWELVYEKGAAS